MKRDPDRCDTGKKYRLVLVWKLCHNDTHKTRVKSVELIMCEPGGV